MIGLARNATWSGVSAAVRASTGLLLALLSVRLLGGQRYGQLATLLSFFVLYLSLNSGVYTVLVTRLMAGLRDGKSADALGAAGSFAVLSVLLLALLTSLLTLVAPVLLSLPEQDAVLHGEIRRTALAMGVLTAFQITTALNSALIEGAGRLDLAARWQLVGPVLITVTLGVLLVLQVPLSSTGYVTVLCVGAFVDLSVLVRVRRALLPGRSSLKISGRRMHQIGNLLKSGFTLQAASLMSLFLEPLNKLLLTHFVGPLAVTAYDLAMKVIWGIQSLFTAAMRVFLHLAGEHGQVVGRAFSRVFILVLVPVMAVHTVGAVFLSWVAHQWVAIGDPWQFMVFFAVATVSNLGMIYITPLYISLIGRGDLRFIFRSQVIVAATNLIVSLALIPLVGLLGAAVGLLFATLYNVVAIYLRHERSVGRSGGLKPVFEGRTGRFLLTAALFAAAILSGARTSVNYAVEAAILLVVCIIIVREPLAGTLLARMRVGK